MKCLVLGGGGFIGSSLVDRLLADRHQVRVFERSGILPYRAFLDDEPIEWVTGDILNVSDVNAAVDGMEIVFHLVSTTLPKRSNDDMVFDVESNVLGTLRFLDCCVRSRIRKVIFISSGGTVYGHPQEIPISETHPTEPVVSYGIVKLAIEKYLHLFYALHGLDYAILRVANPYGRRQRIDTAQGAVSVFISKAINRSPIEIWGDGTVVRDYLYVDDVVEAFARVMEHEGEPRLFNVGSGCGHTLNELLDSIEQAVGFAVQRQYLPGRPFDVAVSVLDVSRAGKVLGWTPSISLSEGIGRTITWFLTEGGGTPADAPGQQYLKKSRR